MILSQAAKKMLRPLGLELTRLRTHRGVVLEADIKRLLGGGCKSVIFDAGANVGHFALGLAKAFPNAEFYCFEPITETFRALQIATSRLPQVHLCNIALGERSSSVEMSAKPLCGSNRILEGAAALPVGETEKVTLLTGAEFCESKGIDRIGLVKTDCEGYDLQVLEGFAPLLNERKVRLVYCEVNMRRDGRHGDFFAIHELLNSYGYAFYALYDYSGIGSAQKESFCNALWVDNSLAV